MNSLELRKEVTRLKQVKKKNEENVPMEDLAGKYKEAYARLCENLKISQAELKTRYINFLSNMIEILSDAVYADPDEEYQLMRDRFHEFDETCDKDPFFRAIMSVVFSFEDYQAEENKCTQNRTEASEGRSRSGI